MISDERQAEIVAALRTELDFCVDAAAENPVYYGNARARYEGRGSSLAMALSLLTGESADDILKAADVRRAERQGRLDDAWEGVIVKGEAKLRRPWCDCANKGQFTRNRAGVWVQWCCGRPTKHYWLNHGTGRQRAIYPAVSSGKAGA